MTAANPQDLLQEGLALHRRGAVAEAATCYGEVLRIEPGNADAHYYLGMMACQDGRFAEGAEYARKAVINAPEHARGYVLLGRALHALRRQDEAVKSLKHAIALTPNLAQAHSHLADILSDSGRKAEAVESYDRALALAPDAFDDWFNRGLALQAIGRREEALTSFDRAAAIKPDFAQAFLERGNVLWELNRFDDALLSVDKATAIEPNLAQAWHSRGNILSALKRSDEALSSYDKALALKPDLAGAWLGRGNVLHELERYDEASAAYDEALALNPDLAGVWLGRGNVFTGLKRYDDALATYDKALVLSPDLAEAWLGRGQVFTELKRYDDAFAAYDKVLALSPDLAKAWLGRGNVFAGLKRNEDASAAYDKALALSPDLAEAWLARGNILRELKRNDDAFAAFERALALKPDLAEAWLGRGSILRQLKRNEDAFVAFDKALALKPDLAEAWLGRGNVFTNIGRHENALAAYDSALALKSDLAEAWLGRGNALLALKQYHKAFSAYDRALALKASLKFVEGLRLHAKLHVCDWESVESETSRLVSAVRAGKLACPPFAILSVTSSAADQLQCAQSFMGDQPSLPAIWRGEEYSHDRIRLAYLSGDFQEHAIAILLAGLFERHDRSRFEVFGLSFGLDQKSKMRERIKGAFEHFIDVGDRSEQDIAELIRRHEVDIVVDLMGLTGDNRLNVLARRPAPIQVNYLGYIATMGAPFIDYVIADQLALPFDQQSFYTEKIVHLPECFLGTDDRQEIISRTPSREEAGLPREGFVFCSFNNTYKLNRQVFLVWMRLLRAVPGSVLWLAYSNPEMVINLRREAEECGVPSGRIVFAPRLPLREHLARQRLAGLFLDTTPYNAGATAAAALWSGVPVLTVLGHTFVGRMAASMLHAVGTPDLVTNNLDHYEALALKLARDADLLLGIRRELQSNLKVMPLFDTDRFRRHIETAYSTMWRRHQQKQPPVAFAVQRIN
jgi:protein O-GlcNAc transferase